MLKDEAYNYNNKVISFEELPTKDYSFKIDVICDECGKEFKSCKKLLLKNKHELCHQCAIKLHRRKPFNVGDKVHEFTILEVHNTDDLLFYTCQCSCGKILDKTQRELQTTCTSCGCVQKIKASEIIKQVTQHQKRENHPNWKGGISTENELIRNSVAYKDFRQKVMERDAYTCVLCKQRGGKLTVHHLNNFAGHRDEVFNVDNGVTLCEDCHKLYHHIFGINTTKEQFMLYMNNNSL